MKNLLPLLLLTCLLHCGESMGQTIISQMGVNNVRVQIRSNGMFAPSVSGAGAFRVPQSANTSTMYSGGLWLGIPDAGPPKVAAHTYGQHDFWCGPLTTDGLATISPNTILQYDRIWVVNRNAVIAHHAYHQCLADPGCDVSQMYPSGYDAPEALTTWPAHGDVNAGQSPYLAPFFDADTDGQYDPEAGDLPCVPGDQALFMIYNDVGNGHANTGGGPLRVEVHQTLFAYSGSNQDLNHTVFAHYRIINRHNSPLEGLTIAAFADLDIGCPDDDLIGTDVGRNMVFVYNGTANDVSCLGVEGYGENPPAFGMVVLKGPLLTSNGMDDPPGGSLPAVNGTGFGDGIADNERHGLSRSMVHWREGPSYLTGPNNDLTFHQYLTTTWKDGTPLTYGGNGYNTGAGAISSRFAFPGTTDPTGAGTQGQPQPNWNAGFSPLTPDPRALAIMGPVDLAGGEEQDILIAYVYARPASGSGIAPVNALRTRVDNVRNFAQTIPGIMAPGTSCDPIVLPVAHRPAISGRLLLHPNPVADMLYLDMPEDRLGSGHVRILDARGALVLEGQMQYHAPIDVGGLVPGIYQVQLMAGNEVFSARFVKQ